MLGFSGKHDMPRVERSRPKALDIEPSTQPPSYEMASDQLQAFNPFVILKGQTDLLLQAFSASVAVVDDSLSWRLRFAVKS